MSDAAPVPLPEYVLKLSCKDRPGLTAAVAGALGDAGCNLNEAQQFNDPESGQYFQRIGFSPGPSGIEAARDALRPVVETFAMASSIRDLSIPRKVVLMVSKFDHCLGDLLYRNRIGGT